MAAIAVRSGAGHLTELATPFEGCLTLPRRDAPQLQLLSFSTAFPSRAWPTLGVFVAARLAAIQRWAGARCLVIAPTPYFPRVPVRKAWYAYALLPLKEKVSGMQVVRPRYLQIPKFGGSLQARSIAAACEPLVASFLRRHNVCVLDAHFAYPTGAAVRRLARRFGLPYIVTGRGEDMTDMLASPALRREIAATVRQASALIAVSHQIAGNMLALGACESKVYVIPNGVDEARFAPVRREAARNLLQLPPFKHVVLSVGSRIRLKGHDIVIRAVARLVRTGWDVGCLIVGGPVSWERDTLRSLRRVAAQEGLSNRVVFAGPQSPDRMKWWYGAADVLCLASRREGCPNVVLEALACGRPVVATPVGELPHLINNGRNGFLVGARCPDAFAAALRRTLSRRWSPEEIRATVAHRNWYAVAQAVRTVIDAALEGHRRR